jgi:hypothetical protein
MAINYPKCQFYYDKNSQSRRKHGTFLIEFPSTPTSMPDELMAKN